jgi:hypothetical protein
MNDIKAVASVIKTLERTIGILENCNDIGKIPDITRKRVIEMLNKATLEIYFLSTDSSDEKISESGKTAEKEQPIESPVISDIVEEIVPENTNAIQQQPIIESVTEKIEENNLPETIPDKTVIDNTPEQEVVIEEEVPTEENVVEEENIVETVPEENTVSEESIFRPQDSFSDKPLFEWEIDKSEPVQETQEANKEDEINILKLQLEEERKRLEQELQNWQDEKRRRDEEIFAAKKLLENLQQQAAISQAKQQSVSQQPVQQPQPTPQQQFTTRQSPPVTQPVPSEQIQQPQQPAKKEPFINTFTKEPTKKEEPQETLSDRFIGTKKVLYENFESDNMVNQISTPVSSLPKAIGINDRFRFVKELFGGDFDLYNETIKVLDNTGSLVSAISYIESNFSWDKNSDSVKQLISLIRRRYM